jgi:hypothetical protein
VSVAVEQCTSTVRNGVGAFCLVYGVQAADDASAYGESIGMAGTEENKTLECKLRLSNALGSALFKQLMTPVLPPSGVTVQALS